MRVVLLPVVNIITLVKLVYLRNRFKINKLAPKLNPDTGVDFVIVAVKSTDRPVQQATKLYAALLEAACG